MRLRPLALGFWDQGLQLLESVLGGVLKGGLTNADVGFADGGWQPGSFKRSMLIFGNETIAQAKPI